MLVIAACWLSILLLKAVLTLRIIWRDKKRIYNPAGEGVTILQPILSGDPGLARVLEANVVELKQATFMWLIDDDDNVARETVRDLQRCYPHSDITVKYFPAAPEGVNPKAFKIEQAWREVKNERVLVLDDDAMLSDKALNQILYELRDGVLVTALPYYSDGNNFFSALLAQFVNDNSAQTYLPLLSYMPPLTINGMCYALTTRTLAAVGGLAQIQHHLTDDLALASLLNQHQMCLVQSTALVKMQTILPGGRKYVQQMHRWFLFATLLLREKPLKINIIIFLLQGLHPLLLWSMLFSAVANPWLFISCLVIRHFTIRKVQRELAADMRPHPLYSLISELLQPVHLLHALCIRTIVWRTRRYRVFGNEKFISQ